MLLDHPKLVDNFWKFRPMILDISPHYFQLSSSLDYKNKYTVEMDAPEQKNLVRRVLPEREGRPHPLPSRIFNTKPLYLENRSEGKSNYLEEIISFHSFREKWIDNQFLLSKKRRIVNPIYQSDSSLTRKELPIMIKGRKIRGQPDTGAEGGNFISQDLASELGLTMRNENDDCKSFSIGNGKVMRAIGSVKALCTFVKEPQTKFKCWFYVCEKLASPLIMGFQFLEKTKTMSVFKNRLEDRFPSTNIYPMLNLIGSTKQSKRRVAAFIDGRYTYINPDSGSDLDLMSSRYVKSRDYKIDRRRECRKRIRLADTTIVETIGQVSATLTLNDGSSYLKLFDVLPGLTSDVLLGESALEEIDAFTAYESSFVNVSVGERHLELSVLSYLGRVNEFLVHTFRRSRRRFQAQPQRKLYLILEVSSRLTNNSPASLAKQQDDAMMEDMLLEDLEAERNRWRNDPAQEGAQQSESAQRDTQEPQPLPVPPIPHRSARRG